MGSERAISGEKVKDRMKAISGGRVKGNGRAIGGRMKSRKKAISGGRVKGRKKAIRGGRAEGNGGGGRALALCLALTLWREGPRAQGACWEGAPPADGVRWALAGVGAGASGAVGVVDLGDGPRWLPALQARAAAPLLLWRAPRRPCVGCAPQWLEGARGYVLAASSFHRLFYFLCNDTMNAVPDHIYQVLTGSSRRKMQLNSAVPVVMGIRRDPMKKNGGVLNIPRPQGHGSNRIARHILLFEDLPYSDQLNLENNRHKRGFEVVEMYNTEMQLQIQSQKEAMYVNETARGQWPEDKVRQRAPQRGALGEGVGAEQMQLRRIKMEPMYLNGMTRHQSSENELGQRGSQEGAPGEGVSAEQMQLQLGLVERVLSEGKGRERRQTQRDRAQLKDDSIMLSLLRLRHQSFRGVVLREHDDGNLWRGLAIDPETGRNRVYRWKSGGGYEDGDEGHFASAALVATRFPDSTPLRVRALGLTETGHANLTKTIRGIKVSFVGYFIPLLEEMKKRLHMKLSVELSNFKDFKTGDKYLETVEKLLIQGYIELVPHYFKFTANEYGHTTLMDIVSSGEPERFIVLVPIAGELPAWSLPLRVFSARIWLLLLATAGAYALAWRVVARESLAASVAAALRVFSSCGGFSQNMMRSTPQRLQMAAALFGSAVVIVAAYQGRLFDLITNPEHEAEIDTFDQLIEQKMTMVLPVSQILPFVEERLHRIPKITYNSEQELSAIFGNKTKERYALFFDSEFWQAYGASFNPEIIFYREMREILGPYQLHFCSRRNWPWSEILKLFMLQMEDTGLVPKWKQNFLRAHDQLVRLGNLADAKPLKRDAGPKELTPKDVIGHLQLLCAGLVVSALAFCAELWSDHRAGERLRRRSRQARAQLSRGWRRMLAGFRQVKAQIRRWRHCAKAAPLPPQRNASHSVTFP